MVKDKKTIGSAEGQKDLMVPSISLPKGGGAIRDIGEKFSANPVNGTGSLTVPIAASPSRSGFGPELSLSYDSGAGNGPFGFGWNLSLSFITRKTEKGLPQYFDNEESDVYVLSGVEDLVPVLLPGGSRYEDIAANESYTIHRYRPRIESLFARIERWTNRTTGEIHWRSITRDNITNLYGKNDSSRIADPDNPGRFFSWLICESYDNKGNAIVYEYVPENDKDIDTTQANERNRIRNANRYLKRIKYGNRVSRLVQPDLAQAEWLFNLVFDYDEGHYEELGLDPARSEADQHRFVRASSLPGHHWTVRPDPFSSYNAGFEVRTYRRCRRILMFHHFAELGNEPCLVRSTELDYADFDYSKSATVEVELAHPGSTRKASFICAVTQSGFVRDCTRPVLEDNGVKYTTYLKKSLPPLEFKYSKATIQDDLRQLDECNQEDLPIGLDGTIYQWVDFDGEGVSGILTEQAGAWFYKPNLGGGCFGPQEAVEVKPSLANLSGGAQQLLDLTGDGRLDVAVFAGPTPGFYKRTEDNSWEPFRAFNRLPNIAWDDPNVRFIDLNSDGHVDVLITENDVFTWYPSLAEEGFGPAEHVRQTLDEEHGPRLVLADGTQSVYLADMSGDGLMDVVRIRNCEVCYWPNMGYGRFGAKVTMDRPPWFDHPDQFNQQRIRLADIDGSGATDIIYLGRDGVRLYFNQSGNSWSEPRYLSQFPLTDNLASVMVVDLLGNGTACLVWSSVLPGNTNRPIRYIDLMGGQKPHMLTGVVNNLGAETRIHYTSSAKFYLADKLAGKPWISKLPFPVHVVERVETYDLISGNHFVTRYSYHHGYFDGTEREFRGFGMVEQWDTEHFASIGASNLFPAGTNVEGSSHVPPVLTRTWFHTGVFMGRNHVSDYFAGLLDTKDAGEYYREPGLTDEQAGQFLLEDTILPDGLTFEEEREACRALKGSMLRQELYALDGTDKEKHPYTVIEQNFTIRCLQPKSGNRHGVFFTHSRESITYQYERAPHDPRIAHALTLEVDEFGNVLKSAAVSYGRRKPDVALEPRDQDKQRQQAITYTENDFTNWVDAADDYHTPVICSSRTYELTGYIRSGSAGRFRDSDFIKLTPSGLVLIFDSEINYEEKSGVGRQRRLLEHVRTYYRPNDLGLNTNDPLDLLPLGQLESLSLPGISYKLAFTPGLLTKVFRREEDHRPQEELLPMPTDVLQGTGGSRGGYVELDRDGHWWIPSARVFYSPDTDDTPYREHNYARAHFFLPRRYRDPFHSDKFSTETFINYDTYDLLMQETRDALGNLITAGERNVDPNKPLVRSGLDYRMLQPVLVMDPNRNRSAVCFDALGMVAGTAVMGKPEDVVRHGDFLDGSFVPDLTTGEIDAHLRHPLDAPHAILGRATTRLVYDLFAYSRTKGKSCPQPAVLYTLVRETHDANLAPSEKTNIQHSFSYSDGFGREIQRKIQVKPGPVPIQELDSGRIDTILDELNMTTNVGPRWVVSGWTVFNNKGKPVRQYEPFFTDTHSFEFDVRIGISPVLFYDPMERVVATLHPNCTWEKVVFGPWRQEIWDVNDTVLKADPKHDPDVGDFFRRLPEAEYLPTWYSQRYGGALGPNQQAAAVKAAVHADTPTTVYFDTLGRMFLTVTHNKFKRSNVSATDQPTEEFYRTSVTFDIEGNQREVTDAKDRAVVRYDYDMLGNRIYQASMDAGQRWMLNDAEGKLLLTWDSRGNELRSVFDQLRRQIESYLSEEGGAELLTGQTVYGEACSNPEASNLRGKAVQVFDQAGLVTNERYDFKGNLLGSVRQLAREYKKALNWSTPVALERAAYTSHTRYDALNRPIEIITPDSSVIRPFYNEANLLERVEANIRGETLTVPFVTGIDYNAKGQRTRIAYGTRDGKGISTTYAYDPNTFRLTHLLTRRVAASHEGAYRPEHVQDLCFTYDPVGNITNIRDDAQQTIFFRNRFVEPSADYTYDAVYRLIEARGREHLGQTCGQLKPLAVPDPFNGFQTRLDHPGDGSAMGTYVERYVYDVVGNILAMQHRGSHPANPGWSREYAYHEASQLEPGKVNNRLSSTALGAAVEKYLYDGSAGLHGNMTAMPHLPFMQWDYLDQLHATAQQKVSNCGTPETTWYVYDAGGQRVRKVTERQAAPEETPARKAERIYLNGFEIYREYEHDGCAIKLERETLHIMDDKQLITLVETRTKGNDDSPARLVRYQFSNHLGSASLELDDEARIISFEEYYPFGSTSYQAVRSRTEAPKRYRYTGKERDEESGLYYHGARYYSPWLGRWTSCDPAEFSDGVNRYNYVQNNPIKLFDPNGKWGVEMHFTGVYWSGRLAGATHTEAVKAALASQSLDDFEETAAPHMKISASLAPATPRAFLMNRANNSHALNVTREESGFVATVGIHSKNLLVFGLGLHTVGDFLPHANLTGEPSWGHQAGINEDYSTSYPWSKAADNTFRNPQKALATFERFRSMWWGFKGTSGPISPLSQDQLAQLSKFIYARNRNEMSKAFHEGLVKTGVSSEELKEVESLLQNEELRKEEWSKILQTQEGQKAKISAGNLWDFIKQGKNTNLFNATKVDISEDLKQLPLMPVDPRYEQEKQRNKERYEFRQYLNKKGFL
ncbi:SpvB/TcaC N-terminal domain-containing protein [Peribacillus simplex]|uniref:SpvB/TcaC N-terminal domain-containing protein n=1 Tax=Peribacillus simplex TaxID=1478 RepID=UPI001C884863|nr:SpvB/TcaC N-terminal domain-containing protein [Peribacillus simplex]